MDIRKLDENVSVSPQLRPEEITELATLGFRSVICNRPDGEEPGQPGFAEIEAAARQHGLEARFVPVISGALRPEDVAAFDEALRELPGPVLAYCRSGTRSAMLWALAQAGRRPADELLAAARRAGYDLEPIRPALNAPLFAQD